MLCKHLFTPCPWWDLFLLISLVSTLLPYLALSQPGYCSMYGHCAPSTGDTTQPIDCVSNPPVRAVPATFNLSYCPHLQLFNVCCDSVQYEQFAAGFEKLASLLSTCPACVENFRTFLCDLSCGGDQASFMKVSSTTSRGNATIVNGTDISLSTPIALRLYDSCKNVQEAAAGGTVFSLFEVTAMEQLYTSLISGSNSPIRYNWTFTDDSSPGALTTATLHRPLYSCDDISSNLTCTCGDCPTVCNRCPGLSPSNDTSLVVAGVWPSFGHNYLDRVWYGSGMGLAVYIAVMLIAAVGAQWTASDEKTMSARSSAKQVLTGVGLLTGAVVMVYVVNLVWMLASSGEEVTVEDEVGMVRVLSSWLDPLYFAFLVISFVAMLITLGYFVYRYTQAHPYTFMYHPSLLSSLSDESSLDDKSSFLARYSALVVDHPFVVITAALLLTFLCGLGLLSARLESDPIGLWVSPSSQVLKDKQYFDDTFGAFYRTEQLIVTSTSSNSSLFTPTTLLFLSNLTTIIRSLSVSYTDVNDTRYTVTLDQLCYRPIPSQGCVVESPLEWFNRTDADNPAPILTVNTSVQLVRGWVQHCAGAYFLDECRGSIGAPTFPYVVLGGYNGSDYTTAAALIFTFPLNNAADNVEKAKAWEQALIDLMQSNDIQEQLTDAGLHVDYMMERSVADEIKRGTYKDVNIILLSYALMFVYISCALSSGYWRTPPSSYSWTFPLHTKIVLGLCALLIVVFSLIVSVGVVSMLGISVTPIISEVIPFLVLAIGIDNVFLLYQSFRRQPISLSPATRLHRTLSDVGTGIALAAASECGALLLGASTDMPAVQAFAAISAVAIAVDWLMQMTVFCAVMVLDARRMEDGRWDLCACVRDQEVRNQVHAWKAGRTHSFDEHKEEDEEDKVEDADAYTTRIAPVQRVNGKEEEDEDSSSPFAAESYLQQFLRCYYLPVLFHPFVRLFILLLFPLLFFFLLSYGLTHLQLGLDQSTVVPNDSYLQGYFASEAQYLNVGPPLYFVIKNDTDNWSSSSSSSSLTYNHSDYALQNRVCNAVSRCDENSLEGIVSAAACTPGSFIAQPASSWLDTYMIWLSSSYCCAFDPDIPGVLTVGDTCGEYGVDPCTPCVNASSYTAQYARQRPPPDVFEQWLQQWLVNSTCSSVCAFCSAGLFDSINYTVAALPNNTTPLVKTTVTSSRYMSFHTPLRTQSDFIGAIHSAHSISDTIQREQGLNVFPYSIIYVYFQQYLDIQNVAKLNIGLAFLIIFLLSFALLRCFFISIIQVVTIAMIIGDLLGLMALWSVDFNALSLLNLIMAIGISVEFCIHLSTRFLLTHSPSRTLRSAHSVYTVGASVIEGITLTKVTGVLVLGLATSRVFEVYYFRMYLMIVALGVGHGVVWLPVVLSVVGSERQLRREGWCGGWMWGWPWKGAERKVDHEPWALRGNNGEEVVEQEESEDDEEQDDYSRLRRDRAREVDVHPDVVDKERALLDEEEAEPQVSQQTQTRRKERRGRVV